MSRYSVAEARHGLSTLIDRALAGEDVVVTRHGRPVIALKPVDREPQSAAAAVAWLRENRIRTVSAVDSATLVRAMRDEDEG